MGRIDVGTYVCTGALVKVALAIRKWAADEVIASGISGFTTQGVERKATDFV